MWWPILYFTLTRFILTRFKLGMAQTHLTFNTFISSNHFAICHGILDIKNFNNLASTNMMIHDSQVHDTRQSDRKPVQKWQFTFILYAFISPPTLKLPADKFDSEHQHHLHSWAHKIICFWSRQQSKFTQNYYNIVLIYA